MTAGNILNETPALIIIPELEDIAITNESELNNEGSESNNGENFIEQNVIEVPCTSSSQGRHAERLGVQLYDARESFGAIADKHAEAMMLAEAMKSQAETLLRIGEVMDRMAKNEERQTQLLEIMFECLKDGT